MGLKGSFKVAHNGSYKSWFLRYGHLSLPKMRFFYMFFILVGLEHENLEL